MLNLTPHAIAIAQGDGTIITIPPSGHIARVSVTDTQVGIAAGVPVLRRRYGAIEGVPADFDPLQGALVSVLVLAALPDGAVGFYAPDTGPTAIRDDKGHIVAVRNLITK